MLRPRPPEQGLWVQENVFPLPRLYCHPLFAGEETEAQNAEVLPQGHKLTLRYCMAA